MELIFEVRDSEEGGFCARALGYAIFTEAETWNELRENVLEAASLHFEDEAVRPRMDQILVAHVSTCSVDIRVDVRCSGSSKQDVDTNVDAAH